MMINGDLPGLVNVYSLRTGKSPSLIGQSTMNGPFSIAMLNYQRVSHVKNMLSHSLCPFLVQSQ